MLGPASMAFSNTMIKMSKLQAAQVCVRTQTVSPRLCACGGGDGVVGWGGGWGLKEPVLAAAGRTWAGVAGPPSQAGPRQRRGGQRMLIAQLGPVPGRVATRGSLTLLFSLVAF